MADDDRTFDPNQAEANRTRQQGNGVGQREMDLQSDPTRDQQAPLAIDTAKLGEGDNAEADWSESADEGAVHGSNHTARAQRGDGDGDQGQGPKTRQLNKDTISRRS